MHEDCLMDIHKPKPFHNWREFAKEYAIIVLGVATALAGEQIAEKLHDRAKAAEARASIRAEVAQNLGYMERRDASESCTAKRLDEVGGLIAVLAAGNLPQDALYIGTAELGEMDDGRYKSATQSGAVSLFDDKEQAAYATLYKMFEFYGQLNLEEWNDWAILRALESHPPASPALDAQLRSALQLARAHRWGIQGTRLVALKAAAAIDIMPTPVPKIRLPDSCMPLHTTRQEAMKLLMHPDEWNLEPPK